MADNMPQLRKELSHIAGRARLSSAVEDIDKMIDLLTAAREQVASGSLWLRRTASPPMFPSPSNRTLQRQIPTRLASP